MDGSHQTFPDENSLLASTSQECVFCHQKLLANKEHLYRKHLRDAIYFSTNNEEKFVVACFCKDSTQQFRSHYHCPLCNFRIFTRAGIFIQHLKGIHGLESNKRQVEECKRKWKNMRDRYLKEVRMELKSKKQGEILQSRWKYRQLMNFIAPFTGSRSGVGDLCMNQDDDHDNPDDTGSVEGESTSSETVKAPQSIAKTPVSQPDLKPVAFMSQLSPMSQDAQMAQLAVLAKMPSGSQINSSSKTGRKRRLAQDSQSAACGGKWMAKDNGTTFPNNRPRDEDELFLLSFVPALKRLAPQKRCETKMKIQQIMYEAEFNVAQSESQDKQLEPDMQD